MNHPTLSRVAFRWLKFIGQILLILSTLLPFDALSERDPLEVSCSYLVWENLNGWATIWWKSLDDWLSHLGTTWLTQYILWHTDCHVALANAAPMHCVGWQNVWKYSAVWTCYSSVTHELIKKDVWCCSTRIRGRTQTGRVRCVDSHC